jgi:uncharacterized protein (DUF1778 family)
MVKTATRAKSKAKTKSQPNRARPETVMLKLSAEEKQIIQEAAATVGAPTSVWVRTEMLRLAHRLLREMRR